jgi:hypothetical protein
MFQHIGRRGLMGLAIATLLVAGAALAAQGTASGQQLTSAMGLAIVGGDCSGDDCTVPVGADFGVAIVATEAPAVGVSGWQSEVFLDGITWNQNGCDTELQVGRQDALPVSQCLAEPGPGGQARHVLISEVAAPPLPAFDFASGDTLILMSATCDAEGDHVLNLTAVTNGADDAPFGALYFDTNAVPVVVTPQGTAELDQEGDGSTDTLAIADSVNVSCVAAAGPTATPLSVAPTIVPTGSGGPTDDGGSSLALLVTAVALLAATVGGFGLYRWRTSRTA